MPLNDNDEFPQFASFPEEIRRDIWTLSLSPRAIEVFTRKWDRTRQDVTDEELIRPFHFPRFTPLPPIFHVCRESRSETLPRYHSANGHTFYSLPGAFINPEIDTLHCESHVYHVNANTPPELYVQKYMLSRLAFKGPAWLSSLTSISLPMIGFRLVRWTTFSDGMIRHAVNIIQQYKSLREIIITDLGHNTTSRRLRPVSEWPVAVSRKDPADPYPNYRPLFLRLQEEFEKVEREVEGWKAPAIKFRMVERERWRDGRRRD